jgi:hypothetical protein
LISENVVLGLDEANGAGATTTDGCTALTNGPNVAGKIALIDRGTCGFTIKVKNAQDAGAAAVIIADNVAGGVAGMAGADPTITIPSVRITLADGNLIKANLPNVVAQIGADFSILAGADPTGRVRIFSPNPVQSGSSGSHYDSNASRNLLMEPAINGDLTQSLKSPQDLTLELMTDIGWFPDSDLDGVANADDCNPNSNFEATVVINGLNSGVPNTFFTSGCTISDLIAQFSATARNRGAFVSAVAHLAEALLAEGIITDAQKDALVSTAAKAKLPR